MCVCEDDFVSFVNNLPFKSNAEHCKAKAPLLQSSKNEKLYDKRSLHQTVRQKNLSVKSMLTPLVNFIINLRTLFSYESAFVLLPKPKRN